MSENTELITSRLDEFRNLLKLSKQEFSKKLGLEINNFRSYMNLKSFEKARLNELDGLGCNINWLLSGRGIPFNESYEGVKLQKKHNDYIRDSNYQRGLKKGRIFRWIEFHFGYLEQVTFETNYDIEKLIMIRNDSSTVPLDLLEALNREGMNIDWVYGFSNNPYTKSLKGKSRERNYKDRYIDEKEFETINMNLK